MKPADVVGADVGAGCRINRSMRADHSQNMTRAGQCRGYTFDVRSRQVCFVRHQSIASMRSAFAQRRVIAAPVIGLAGLCVCTCSLLVSPQAAAGNFGGSIGATSDYVYRGISESRGNPALQGDFHYQTRSGWAVGAWASTADLRDEAGAGLEVDIYASHHWTIDRHWDAQLSLTHYSYSQDTRALRYDYDEAVATLSYESRVSATVAWSPDVSRFSNGIIVKHAAATSYELTAVQPLVGRLSASLGAGYYDLPARLDADYWFWNAGLTCSLGRARLAVSYIDTDSAAVDAFGYEAAGSRWVGSLAWTF